MSGSEVLDIDGGKILFMVSNARDGNKSFPLSLGTNRMAILMAHMVFYCQGERFPRSYKMYKSRLGNKIGNFFDDYLAMVPGTGASWDEDLGVLTVPERNHMTYLALSL